MISSLAAAVSLERVSMNLQSFYQLRLNRIHKFKAKIDIKLEVGPFELKTVSDSEELKEALALRYEVFHREMMGKTNPEGIDVDEFDFACDHLVIKEKRSNRIVGTYRLNCSLFTEKFYSGKEFMIGKLFAQPGVKLELGRACIHKDFRRGILISLLWRGIAEYMAASDAKLVFGCATVMTADPRKAALLTRYFEEEGRILQEFRTRPTLLFTMPLLHQFMDEIRDPLTETQRAEAESLVPPLCRAYLKAGASISGEPAWDQEFNCIDFLTILQRDDLNRSLWRKYKMDENQ
ncbi:GNAT family N-acetyltransferase [Bdellovibrio reynosensis]|uniref:GNAT family N-acetyltransferase n=1 Tax=Bdellovibrio reynosensis TaxID=2835041 RepID=A0ABY4C5E0_9BACT|nr:GNAT family N-acetyltransferase [Bdellovibrio reynosensis]UOF00093.1 GNAT family N-acetyltransferase [Bdellovibrio reynosensis]